ncbi:MULTISPECIES: helix-turn-helix transcriptional regulator [Mesorhizobium]|uniref:helix-turn-helix domain-containing protein n=1 Tax=Mesorhizobium TaxID=68287 RepID=UPI0003F5723F|nr:MULTISPECIES: helix-turn-helix transcriptional regulator [Mesorhizobium]PBB98969.1 XRE family transcriptional regulator [Mesorhizobium sp. WSM3862]
MKGPANHEKPDEAERLAIADKLRQSREYIGLSQDEVASRLSIPRSALSNIETGQRKVDVIELRKLATLYRRPVSYFTNDADPSDISGPVRHLARTASKLSSNDLEELSRFADFLKSRSSIEEE